MVKPEHQRFGIGRHLLALTEARVKAAKRDVPSETPKTLYVQVCGRDRNAQRILKLAGFQLGSTFQIMECEMESEPPTPTPIDSIDVRTFVVGNDEEAVYEADEEAFLDEFGKEPRTFTQWSRRLNMHDGFDSSLWFVAWDGEQVAGAAMSEPENGKGRVHHLGVRRPWRKRGLGMALMHHTMRAFYQRGVRTMILNVHAQSLTNANKLYERAGFKVVNDYHHYKKSLS